MLTIADIFFNFLNKSEKQVTDLFKKLKKISANSQLGKIEKVKYYLK